MRKPNRLTATEVRNATKPGLYPDGLGLYLQISAFKTKAWVFRFQRDGQARKMGLGPLHTVTLADARQRAAEARRKLLDGIDPIAERGTSRDARKAAAAAARAEAARVMTFRECARAYIEAKRVGWKNSKHAAQWVSTFEETKRGSKIFPAITEAINELPVSEIDTALVLKVLQPIWVSKTETATRVRSRMELVLAWATVSGFRSGDNPARWRGHLQAMLAAPNKIARPEHHAAIPYAETPEFLAKIRARSGISARALEFLVLTATRTNETINSKWDEIDLDAKIWTIPAERMKSGREHRVPLTKRAIAIVKDLPREGDYVFPGARGGRPLSDMALLELVRGFLGMGATVHGFRSSFRDWAGNETNFPREIAEQALAHVIGDKAEQAYRRGDALERRRKLMEAWERYCDAPPIKGAKIVTLRAGA